MPGLIRQATRGHSTWWRCVRIYMPAGVIVTIIFALRPLVRLTNLGIRQALVPGHVGTVSGFAHGG